MALDTIMPAAQAYSASGCRTRVKWPVTVVIRTAGARGPELKRAVQSVVSQQGVDVHCSVVFNGRSCDRNLIAWTRAQPSTSTILLHGGGKREATLLGRELVATPYFCYLDDDDELLANALALRIELLESTGSDCVATNGYYHRHGVEPLFPQTRRFVEGELLEALIEARNWLAAGACMFRTSTVGETFFSGLPPHREWTVIAFRIASALRAKFYDIPTCRIHSSPVSESKKDTYAEASVEAWAQILHANRRDDLLPAIRLQQAAAWRDVCSFRRSKRRFASAWSAYLQALKRGAGWSFVPYGALLLARTTRPAVEIKQSLQAVRFL